MGTPNKQIGWSQESNLLWQICKILDSIQGGIGALPGMFVPITRTLTINGVTYDLSSDRTWNISTTDITVVANFSALPAPNTVPGEFYWAESSQGTQWLPGALGGTYYSAGLYYSNGVSWTFMDVPYQATQAEVDAGIVPNKFVTPLTLNNASKWDTKVDKTTILNINGNDYDLSTDREWRVAQGDSGVLQFSGLTQASATQINFPIVKGYVVDNETDPLNPVYTFVDYPGQNNVTVPTLGSGLGSYVLLLPDGFGSATPVFQTTLPTSAQRKTHLWLGKVGHPLGVISAVINEPDYITSPQAFSRDLFQVLGPYINDGVYPYANGANLQVNITGGNIHGNGINFHISRTLPNEIAMGPLTPMSFLYRTQIGGATPLVNLIDPANYDVGGVVTPIGGGSNNSTLQYIFAVPGLGFIIQYGQVIHSSLASAIAAVGRESFIIYPNLPDNAILIGVLAVNRLATALNDPIQAQFFLADKLGQIIGATAGISTGTLQTAYNNSLVPQIQPTDALGALTVRSARASNSSPIFELQNIAGTTTWSVDGNGNVNDAPQITITTGVSIDTTTTVNGFTQKGRNVVIANGASNINYTCNGADGFVASYVKTGTGSITFVAGGGRSLVQVDGTAVLNGIAGSTATISSVGTVDYLRISNA